MTAPFSIFPDDALDPTNPQRSVTPRPATGTPPSGPSLFPGSNDPDSSHLSQSVRLGVQQPADSAARVLDLALRTGLPRDLIARNLDTIETEAKRSDFDAERFRQTSPIVAKWIAENPTHFALAQDDLDNLTGIEGMLTALSKGWKAGRAQVRAGRLAYQKMMAGGTLSQQEEAALEQFEKQAQGPTGGNLFESILKNTALVGGQMLESADQVVKSATAGMTIGGVSGMLGGPVGVGAGVIGGTAVGATFGTYKSTSETEAGHLYLALGEIRGANGETIDEQTKQHVALAFGAANGLLETISFGVLGKPVANVARQVGQRYFRQAARDALVRPTMRQAMARFGRTYAATLGAEIGTEVAQELSSAVGEEVAKLVTHGQFATLANDPEQREILMDRLAGIAEQTAQGMLLIGLPGASVQLASDVVQVRAAERRSQDWLAFLQRTSEAKTTQRHLPAVEQILAQAGESTGVETVYLDPEPFVEYFQSKGEDPRAVAEELWGDAHAFDQALVSGAPMALPVSRFARVAIRSTDHQFFATEVRRTADEMNAREATAMRAELDAAAQQAPEVDGQQPTVDVEQILTERIAATGRYRETDAALMAQQMAAFLRTVGERTGTTPEALLQRYGLAFGDGRTAQQQTQQAAPMSETDPDAEAERAAMAEEFAWSVQREARDAALRTSSGQFAYARTKGGALRGKLENVATEGIVDELLRLLEENSTDAGAGQLQLRQDENFHSTEDGGTIQVATEGTMRARGRMASRDKSVAKLDAELKRRGLTDREVGELMMRIALASQPADGFDLFQGGTATLAEHTRFSLPLFGMDAAEAQMHRLAIDTPAGQVIIDAIEHGQGQPLEIANIYLDGDAPQNRLGVSVIREVSAILRSEFPAARGVQGTRISGASVRAGVRGRTGEAVFHQDVRGRMRRNLDTGQIAIDVFDSADLSTVLHESGHFYLEVLRDIAGENEAIAADAQTLLSWLGVERFDQITRDHHEKFARGMEAYFMEGWAPSIALRRAFHRFKLWLMAIYRNAEALDVELTPDVRAVFDRLFATEAEIDAARNEAQQAPLFTDAESAGMSPEQFAAYRQTIEDAHIAASDRVRTKAMREWQREREAWWKEERAGIEAQVADELGQQPIYQVLSVLQRGKTLDGVELDTPIKLSKDDLVARKGADFLKSLPRPYVYAVQGGMAVEDVAEQFGFESGDAMLQAILTATPYRQALEAETDRRMRERHGDLMADGTIADVAEAAVMEDDRDAIVRAELRALNAKAREVRPFVQAAQRDAANEAREAERERAYERRWMEAERKLAVAIERGAAQAEIARIRQEIADAKAADRASRAEGRRIIAGIPSAEVTRQLAVDTISRLPIRSIRPHTYWVTARKSSTAAQRAFEQRDYVAAANAKQAELVNLALYREAQRVLERADRIVAHAKQLGQKPAQQRLGKAGAGYLDQVNKLLERFDFRQLTGSQIDRRQALAAWIAAQKEAGITVNIPEELQNDAWRQPWKTLTIDELQGIDDTIRHLEHLAKTKNRLLKAQDERELSDAIGAVEASIRDHAKRTLAPEAETGLAERSARARIGNYIAAHRKLANLVRVMDGLNDGGSVWQLIMRPLNAAGDEKARLTAEMTNGIREVFDRHYSKADWLTMYRKELTGVKNLSLSKMGRLVIALNAGTEDNRAKLVAGLNVTFQGKGLTEADVDTIIDTLDQRDLEFVQAVWDFLDTYWPPMKALAERLDGIAPEKIAARALQTRHGEYRGGYYPIAYDPRQSNRAEQHQMMQAATELRGATTRASTKAGSRNSRVANVKRPLRLDFGTIFGHLEDVAMDLAYTEALYDVNRILRSDEIGAAVRDHYGHATYQAMKDAVDAIARGDEPARTGAEQFFAHLRAGASIATMGWSLSTAAIQPLGLAQSMVRVGPKWVGRAIVQWAKGAVHMENTTGWIQDKSTFMRMRSQTQFRELAEVRNRIGMTSSRTGLFTDKMIADATRNRLDLQDIEDSFFWLITRMQLVADVPTWLGAYNKALESGVDEETAVALADQAVLDSQGGGQIKDMAAVQRGSPLVKIWTTFYGYFNTTFNLLADSFERTDWKRPASIGRLAVDTLMLTVIPATLTAILRDVLRGEDPTDDDDFAEKLIGENLAAFLGLFVGLRETSGFVSGFTDYAGPAGTRFFQELGRFTTQVTQGDVDKALVRAGNQTAGILLHYPALQVQRTAEGIWALSTGRTRNPFAGLFGPPRQK